MASDDRFAACLARMDAEIAASAPNPSAADVLAVLRRHVIALEAREQPIQAAIDEFGHPAVLAAELRAWRDIARQLLAALSGAVPE